MLGWIRSVGNYISHQLTDLRLADPRARAEASMLLHWIGIGLANGGGVGLAVLACMDRTGLSPAGEANHSVASDSELLEKVMFVYAGFLVGYNLFAIYSMTQLQRSMREAMNRDLQAVHGVRQIG